MNEKVNAQDKKERVKNDWRRDLLLEENEEDEFFDALDDLFGSMTINDEEWNKKETKRQTG